MNWYAYVTFLVGAQQIYRDDNCRPDPPLVVPLLFPPFCHFVFVSLPSVFALAFFSVMNS